MKPELKLHSIVLCISTFIIFTIWTQLTTLISAHPFVSVIAGGLISLGLYRLLTVTLVGVFRKSECVKKYILGPYYMEGTWIGFFVGHDSKIRLFAETFEQDISDLVIKGKAFKEDGSYHGSWVSDNVNINVKLGKISYTYEADVIGNSFTNPGLAYFNLERKSSDKAPSRMIGFSSDIFNPAKLKSFEEKVSCRTDCDSQYVFKKATEIYEKYKKHV